MSEQLPTLDTFTPEDLLAAVMLIDYAADQGVFKGWENMNKAFIVRSRLSNFAQQWAGVVPDPDHTITETPEGNSNP